MLKERRNNILNYLSKKGFTGCLLFEPENIYYCTGFWGESVLICTADKTRLFVPDLEVSRAEKESSDCEIIPTLRGDDLIKSLHPHLHKMIACSDCNDFRIISIINDMIEKTKFVSDPERFLIIRSIKDAHEIAMIKKSSQILDKLYDLCTQEIKIGMSEKELQSRLVCEALRLGASLPNYSFTLNPFIVASGPNGAYPHAETSEREFAEGETVVVDLTVRFRGYISDATRTFAIKNLSDEKRGIYETVKSAQKKGLDRARAFVKCSDVDLECRKLISDKGYGKNFIHSTGHGVGLEVHERPWISPENKTLLQENMVITIEPGIYIRSKIGVRIEDTILINNHERVGNEVLTTFTKDLITIDQ